VRSDRVVFPSEPGCLGSSVRYALEFHTLQELVSKTFEGDEILTLDRKFDNYTVRLDETVMPHAIELFEPGKKEPIKGIYEFRGGKLLICTPDGQEKPRPKVVDAKGYGVEDWTETLQRRKMKK
jgi:uncharacterized protein (TIGR03067 family)